MLRVIEYFSKSLKVTGNEKRLRPCWYIVVTTSVSRIIAEIFSVK